MTIVYEFPKIPCLALGECQIIPASLYLTEIVNAALATLHHSDVLDNNDQPTIDPRRARLKEAEKEVSKLLSSLNIYAHHPGLDKMIDDLGKNILHFVKKKPPSITVNAHHQGFHEQLCYTSLTLSLPTL